MKPRKQFQLQINDPCSQAWGQMSNCSGGKFCSSCSKTVIDLSVLNDKEIIHLLSGTTKNICGRAKEDQLNRIPLHSPAHQRKTSSRSKLFAGLFLLFPASLMNASDFIPETEITLGSSFAEVNSEKIPSSKDHNRIYGTIMDSIGEAIPFVIVELKNYDIGATSDIDGKFSISIPVSINDDSLILEFRSIGYKSVIEIVYHGDFERERIIRMNEGDKIVCPAVYELGKVSTIQVSDQKKWWQFWK